MGAAILAVIGNLINGLARALPLALAFVAGGAAPGHASNEKLWRDAMPSYVYLALAITLFSTACAGPASDGDTVLVVDYSPAFLAAAASEYEALPPSCQPGDPKTPAGCSPLKSVINDYRHLRARLAAE